MQDDIIKINWFPGHMKKALDQIKDKIKIVDLFIEVVDSRCVTSSSNDELRKLANNKPILTIALKDDLSNVNKSQHSNILFGSTKNKNFKKEIINKLYSLLDEKIAKYKSKGLMKPKFLIMIVGLPNVGKSSLINFLKSKNTLISRNQPGVTKSQQIVNINENFDLIDTPGILFKNISDITTAYKLSLVNCIKKEILPIEKVLEFGYNFFIQQDKKALLDYYGIQEPQDYFDFVDKVCEKYKFYNSNKENDMNRFETMIFNDFSLCKFGKVHYDE